MVQVGLYNIWVSNEFIVLLRSNKHETHLNHLRPLKSSYNVIYEETLQLQKDNWKFVPEVIRNDYNHDIDEFIFHSRAQYIK